MALGMGLLTTCGDVGNLMQSSQSSSSTEFSPQHECSSAIYGFALRVSIGAIMREFFMASIFTALAKYERCY